MRVLSRLVAALLAAERAFLVLLFSAMILLAFAQVILRNLLGTGLIWADPLLRNAVLWLGFVGASLATRDDKQIRIDLVGRFLPARAASAAALVTDIFTVVVCVLLADASVTFVANEIAFRDTLVTIGGFDVPTWWSQVILPAGFAMIALRVTIRIVLRLAGRIPPPAPAAGNRP